MGQKEEVNAPRKVVFCPELGGRPCNYNCESGEKCFKQEPHETPPTPMTHERALAIATDEALVHKDTYRKALRWAIDKVTRADDVLRRSRQYVQNSKFPGNGAMLAEIEDLIKHIDRK